MGKVIEKVREYIPKGNVIACATSADHLIAAGVSNWGAWGVLAAAEGAIRYGIAANDVDGRGLPVDVLTCVEKATLHLMGSEESEASTTTTKNVSITKATHQQHKKGIFPSNSDQPFQPPPGSWLLPTDSEEKDLVCAMNASGAADGITGERDGSVDGMALEKHLQVLRELRAIVVTEFT